MRVSDALSNHKFHCWVHVSADETPAIGNLSAEGWVFSSQNEKIQGIRALVFGRKWPGQYGLPRPDVALAFPSAKEADYSGFSISFPSLASSFELRLEVKISKEWQIFFCDQFTTPGRPLNWFGNVHARVRNIFTRSQSSSAGYEGLVHGYVCWIDEPTDWRKVGWRFRISGWCFSKNGETIQSIRARIGNREFPANHGLFRPDVVAIYGDRPGVLRSGFEVAVEAPRGAVRIVRLEARREDGLWKQIFSKRLNVPFISRRAWREREISWVGGDYETWIKHYDSLEFSDRYKIKRQIRAFKLQPRFSILMPVYDPVVDHLEEAIKSVRAQLYPHWQLCIVDDASSAKGVRRILSRYEKLDRRVEVRYRRENGGIAAVSNEALAFADGEFTALLDPNDTVAPTAFYFVAREINRHPEAQLIYSDEDKLDLTGRRTNPHFKPDWNWQLFLAQNFVSHLSVFRSDLVKPLGFRASFEGSQDYDLLLRCIEKLGPRQIRHIPHVLYHRRMLRRSPALNLDAKPDARLDKITAVQQHLDRKNIAGRVTRSGIEDFQRIRYVLPNQKPTVSIIIPTRDMLGLLRPCLQSILEKTSYSTFEILLIDNGSRDAAALDYLTSISRDARVRLLRRDEEFNYSRLNNFGVQNSNAEFVILMNNDVTAIDSDWLAEMVSQGIQPGVGAVGARLLYPDGRIQQAGVILGADVGGVAGVAHRGLPRYNHGYFARAVLAQELSAIGAACMLVRRSVYLEVGGFNEEHLKIAFNDVDFCLQLLQRGYRIIYTPYAELYHLAHASRGLEDTVGKLQRFTAEIQYMKERWNDVLIADQHYNPNLSLNTELFTLSFPPRLTKPWQEE